MNSIIERYIVFERTMNMGFIPVNEPLLDGNEKKYLIDCVETGWISSAGEYVNRLEKDMAAYVGRKAGISVCNGSAALEAAVNALSIPVGSEVIMPAFTIISCSNAIIKAGLTPVLVDADYNTWNMDVSQIEEKITDKTKAIMVVHIYGLPVDMAPVIEIAQKHNLYIIEDAAEAIGVTYKGKQCGSFGDISCMSFFANKHVTTGEGGMIFADDDAIIAKARNEKNLYFDSERRYIHEEIGSNFRMTNIQAAIGCAQLEKINDHLKIKRSIGEKYNELLAENEVFNLPVDKTEYADNLYWIYGLVIKDEIELDATTVMKKLGEMGIGTRHFFYPIHLQPAYNKMGLFIGESYPVAEKLAQKGLYIPAGMALTDEQIKTVADCVNAIKA